MLPLSTKAPLRSNAIVCRAAASEPDPGSVSAQASILEPSTAPGMYLDFCSSLPNWLTVSSPRERWASRFTAEAASPLETSWMAITIWRWLPPLPPKAGSTPIPASPRPVMPCQISQENSSFSSISRARGLSSLSANSRTAACSIRSSSVNSRSTILPLPKCHSEWSEESRPYIQPTRSLPSESPRILNVLRRLADKTFRAGHRAEFVVETVTVEHVLTVVIPLAKLLKRQIVLRQ